MNSNDELIKVIERIAAGSASSRDLQIYNQWCNSQQVRGNQAPVIDFEHTQQTMLRKINGQIRRRSILRATYRYSAVAAACLIIFCCVRLLMPANEFFFKQNGVDRAKLTEEIPAGFHLATLKLSNGTRITLNDQADGVFTDPLGMKVNKTTDSTLVYSEKENTHYKSKISRKEVAMNILSTSKASHYQLTLSDGTQIWLNAASSIRFPVSFHKQRARRVEIEGEAYFQVAKDVNKPFIVHSNGQDVKVLGTHFNINNYHDEPLAKTTLLEGSISLNEKLLLHPGEQSQLDRKGAIKSLKVNPDIAVSWRKGHIEFDNDNVFEIMRALSRWYDVEVFYQGEIPLDGMKGNFSRQMPVAKILDIMGSTGLLRFKMIGKKIYVRKF